MQSLNGLGRPMGKVSRLILTRGGQVDLESLNSAINYLDKGGVIAVPTDTIYGLAARVDDSKALDRIYKIKGRRSDKPLAVCISCLDNINEIADVNKLDRRILSSLLPGPITILLKRAQQLNPDLNPGVDTIGVRVPDHNFIKALCHVVGPLALTSANRSGETSPLLAEDFKHLWPELDCVFDDGLLKNQMVGIEEATSKQRLGSTVVDLSHPKNRYTIVREGCALNRTVNILSRLGFRANSVADKQ